MCLLLSLLMQQKLKLKTYTTTFVKAPLPCPPNHAPLQVHTGRLFGIYHLISLCLNYRIALLLCAAPMH